MFNKILIANRGEIACRVARTASRMGVRTVAVYSDADEDAPHAAAADESIRIGPPPAQQSYLDGEAIIAACQRTNAEAIHPGYGFLSENASFAQQVNDAGIVLIGPKPRTIRTMGDKIQAKQLAVEAGLQVVPGHPEAIQTPEHAVSLAQSLGFPVLFKATAGGGGKGMRIVRSEEECRRRFQHAGREAQASFGDGRILVEKLIEHARHIEIQIVADAYGNIVHLGERECSLQRRHQKVIEESPSLFLDENTRTKMSAQAVSLARAAQYESAGTVEFLVARDRSFYFLEMNTRLQVEHPVTECVTGVDLVELMIRIAAGERLPLSQADVVAEGWAIESRIYAEDSGRGFLPSVGQLTRYLPPRQTTTLRVDTGVKEGSHVTVHYDPLLAKLIVHSATREEAIERTRQALDEFCIQGVENNIGFLSSLLQHSRFRSGDLSTDMIAAEYPTGYDAGTALHPNRSLLAAVAASTHYRYRQRAVQISGQLSGYEASVPSDWVVIIDGDQQAVTVLASSQTHEVSIEDEKYDIRSNWQPGELVFRASVNGQQQTIQVERVDLSYRLRHRGVQREVAVVSARTAELLNCMPTRVPSRPRAELNSPMPGLLSSIAVAAGDEVREGQVLAVVEAMKMENVLRADYDARVSELLASEGDTLAVEQPIMRFEE